MSSCIMEWWTARQREANVVGPYIPRADGAVGGGGIGLVCTKRIESGLKLCLVGKCVTLGRDKENEEGAEENSAHLSLQCR